MRLADLAAMIDEHADRGDVLPIIQACNTLSGLGSMLFGVSLREIANPQDAERAARAGLKRGLLRVPLEQTDTVRAALGRTTFPLDTSAFFQRLADAARQAIAAIEAALASITDVDVLIETCAVLEAGGAKACGIFFGSSWPGRAELCGVARGHLLAAIAALPPDRARAAIIAIRRAELDIDLAEVSSAISHVDSNEPRYTDIDAAIDAAPDDPANYAVLGDWLAERGHARGALIGLHLRAETEPELAAAARDYVSEHGTELLGVLHDIHIEPLWRRGFLDEVTLRGNTEIHLAEQVVALLDHPSARRLRSMILIPDYGDRRALDDALTAIARRAPVRLRQLVLGTQLDQTERIDLAPIWRDLPHLDTLIVRGRFGSSSPIRHAALARAQFETTALHRDEAQLLATAEWPLLEHLDVWFGGPDIYDDDGEDYDDGYGDDVNADPANHGRATIADATALLARRDLPRLRHLGLMNASIADELCDVLATAPLAAQVTNLDLSLGTMTRAGADALIAAAPKLRKLELLDVSNNYLDAASVARLRAAFRTVHAGDQRTDHGNRYPAVIE